MNEWVGWVALFVAVVAGVVSIVSALINRGGERQRRREPTWTELLARVTSLEAQVETMRLTDNRKAGAFARILRAIADQWPPGSSPDLDPEDMALVEETIPPQWIRRRRRRTGRTAPIDVVPTGDDHTQERQR